MCVKCWNLLYFIKVLFFDILNSVYMTWIPNVAYSCAIKLSQEPIFSPKLLGNKPTFHEKPRFLACTEQNVRCSGHKIFIDQNWNKLVEGTNGRRCHVINIEIFYCKESSLSGSISLRKIVTRKILAETFSEVWQQFVGLICICAKDVS